LFATVGEIMSFLRPNMTAGSSIVYNTTVQSKYFNWYAADGSTHQVWYDDPDTLRVKYSLAKRAGMRGLGIWGAGAPLHAARPHAVRAELQERLRSGGAAPVLLEVQSAPLCHALPKITHEGSYPKQGSYPLISLSEPCTRSNEEHRRRQKKKPNKPSLPNKPTLTLACKTRAMWGRNWRHSAAKTSGCGT